MSIIFTIYLNFFYYYPYVRIYCQDLIFIRPSSDGTYYGMVMSVRPGLRPSVRPSVRHSFPHFSPTCFDILIWNFVYHFIFMHVRSSSNAINFRHFLQELCSFLTSNSLSTLMQFSALFSYMLWHIEFKFCIWLCLNVPQSKFECHHFASIFVGVMPLCELRILEIHSFPHFSLTCFDILSWKFAYYYVLLYYRSSSSVVNFASIFVGVMPLLELRILEIHSFPHFSLTPFNILSWKFAYYFVLLYYRSSSSVVNLRLFWSYASFRT